MVYESSGMMASLLGVSFEAFVLDNEMLSLVNRMLRGVELSDDTLAFDAMQKVIEGAGHFIGETQTMQAMQRDYVYPTLADRLEPDAWAESGSTDAYQRARQVVTSTLEKHQPNYIDESVDQRIRQSLPIRL